MEVRFAKSLYERSALDEAVRTYSDYARIDVTDDSNEWLVAIEATGDFGAEVVADELANFALGATIEASSGNAEGASSD